MFEPSDDSRRPTLSERLRDAAVDRARRQGTVIDDVVLDENGVIDLRDASTHSQVGSSATEPASALAVTRGELHSAHDVSDLYATETETKARWWRPGHGRPDSARVAASPELAALTAIDEIDLGDERTDELGVDELGVDEPGVDEPVSHDTPPTVVVDRTEPPPVDSGGEPGEIVVARPTGTCPSCGGQGERDLFDPFSRTEYYSCNECLKMWQEPRT